MKYWPHVFQSMISNRDRRARDTIVLSVLLFYWSENDAIFDLHLTIFFLD